MQFFRRTFICFIISFSLFARPDQLEVWFVSSPSVTMNKIKIPLELQYEIASVDTRNCKSLNDEQCFHPQYGVVSKKDGKKVDFMDEQVTKTADSIELSKSDILRCEKTYHFDMFCGKEAKIKRKKANVEIWIDTSSSMRSYDFAQKDKSCNRKAFMTLLRSSCKNTNFHLSSFAGTIKSQSHDNYLCENTGVNNQDKLISWMEASIAKNLIVITDASQLTLKMTTYLESRKAKIRGMDDKDIIYANKLKELVPQAAAYCKY